MAFPLINYQIKGLPGLTLVGPTRETLVPDPLAVKHLDNQLYINLTKSPFFYLLRNLVEYKFWPIFKNESLKTFFGILPVLMIKNFY